MLNTLEKICIISFAITCIAILILLFFPNNKKQKQSKANKEGLIMKNEIKSVIKVLQDKISQNENKLLYMITLGKSTNPAFTVSPDGTGLQVQQLGDFVLQWEHFEKIVKKANSLGGKMYRGDALPQISGFTLGTEIPHDCMEGFIASELLNTEDGKSVTRRSTYYSGILAWAGIVTLNSSDGKGSYITVNSAFRDI